VVVAVGLDIRVGIGAVVGGGEYVGCVKKDESIDKRKILKIKPLTRNPPIVEKTQNGEGSGVM